MSIETILSTQEKIKRQLKELIEKDEKLIKTMEELIKELENEAS